jgi:hypothetical protein
MRLRRIFEIAGEVVVGLLAAGFLMAFFLAYYGAGVVFRAKKRSKRDHEG